MADGDPTPKQFRRLGDATVLAHAVRPFLARGAEVVVVAPPAGLADARAALGADAARVRIVEGGETRQASTLRGLRACRAGRVHVHDAARPYVTPALIERVEAALGEADGVVPVLRVTDTVKALAGEGIERTVPRESLGLAQTPQFFRRAPLLEAHERMAEAHPLTDDAALIEAVGGTLRWVEGDPANRKITVAGDLSPDGPAAHAFADIRVGHGYDTHRTAPGDTVCLCGVEIAAPFTLDGHSDADVGLHALVDAMLGTCGLGDIGTHFPPSEPEWRGRESSHFLAHAAALLRERGGIVACADVTLVCERPKIGPHVPAMRARIAELLDIGLDRVSVKATTNERVGFIGREEGIAALAVATVRYG